jgi:hypothetical protein
MKHPCSRCAIACAFACEFALLMISAGRIEEAAAAFEHLEQLIETIDT